CQSRSSCLHLSLTSSHRCLCSSYSHITVITTVDIMSWFTRVAGNTNRKSKDLAGPGAGPGVGPGAGPGAGPGPLAGGGGSPPPPPAASPSSVLGEVEGDGDMRVESLKAGHLEIQKKTFTKWLVVRIGKTDLVGEAQVYYPCRQKQRREENI